MPTKGYWVFVMVGGYTIELRERGVYVNFIQEFSTCFFHGLK
jgi:hypothetical protein